MLFRGGSRGDSRKREAEIGVYTVNVKIAVHTLLKYLHKELNILHIKCFYIVLIFCTFLLSGCANQIDDDHAGNRRGFDTRVVCGEYLFAYITNENSVYCVTGYYDEPVGRTIPESGDTIKIFADGTNIVF